MIREVVYKEIIHAQINGACIFEYLQVSAYSNTDRNVAEIGDHFKGEALYSPIAWYI